MAAGRPAAWEDLSSESAASPARFRIPAALLEALPFSLDLESAAGVEVGEATAAVTPPAAPVTPPAATEGPAAQRAEEGLDLPRCRGEEGLAVPGFAGASQSSTVRPPKAARRPRVSKGHLPPPSSSEDEADRASTRLRARWASSPASRPHVSPTRGASPPANSAAPSQSRSSASNGGRKARVQVQDPKALRAAGGTATRNELTRLLKEAADVIETLEGQAAQLRGEADAYKEENRELRARVMSQHEMRCAVDAALAQNQVLREHNTRLKQRVASLPAVGREMQELRAENAMAVDVIARLRLQVDDLTAKTGRVEATSLAYNPPLATRMQRSYGPPQASPDRVELCVAQKIAALSDAAGDRKKRKRGAPPFTFERIDGTTYVVKEVKKRLHLTATTAGVVMVRTGGGAVDIDTYLAGVAQKVKKEEKLRKELGKGSAAKKKSSRSKTKKKGSAAKKAAAAGIDPPAPAPKGPDTPPSTGAGGVSPPLWTAALAAHQVGSGGSGERLGISVDSIPDSHEAVSPP